MDRKQFLVGMAVLAAGSVFKPDSMFAQTRDILSASTSPQETGKSDCEKHGLRGPVKTVVEERTYTGTDGQPVRITTTTEYTRDWKHEMETWTVRNG